VFWRFTRAGTAARALQACAGALLLLLVLRDRQTQPVHVYAGRWHGAYWEPTLSWVAASVLLCAVGYVSSFAFEERELLEGAAVHGASVLAAVARLARRAFAGARPAPAPAPAPVLQGAGAGEGADAGASEALGVVAHGDADTRVPLLDAAGASAPGAALALALAAEEAGSAGAGAGVARAHGPARAGAGPALRRRGRAPPSVLHSFCSACHVPFVFGCSAYILALSVCAFSFLLSFYSFEPNTSCLGWLALQRDSTLLVSPGVGSIYQIGSSELVLRLEGEQLTVQDRRSASPDAVLWRSVPGRAFLRVGRGLLDAWELGSVLNVQDLVTHVSKQQTVDEVEQLPEQLVLRGRVGTAPQWANYSVTLAAGPAGSAAALSLAVQVSGPAPAPAPQLEVAARRDSARLYLVFARGAGEALGGLGAQPSYPWLARGCVPVLARHKGLGRGLQPFTFLMNRFARELGGSWQHAHTAVPAYVSSAGRAGVVETEALAVFDLTEPGSVTVEVTGAGPALNVSARFSALALREADPYARPGGAQHAGRMRALPDWAGEGLVADLGGGSAAVRVQLRRLRAKRVALAAVLLRDWTGLADTELGPSPIWDLRPSRELYPDWDALAGELRAQGLRVLLAASPRAAVLLGGRPLREAARPRWWDHKNESSLFQDALDRGCLVTMQGQAAGAAQPYVRHAGGLGDVSYGLVQLLDPACLAWYADALARAANQWHAHGWLADHGEDLPFGAALPPGDERLQQQHHQQAGSEGHGKYAAAWLRCNDRAVQALDRHPGDAVVITRTATVTTQTPDSAPRLHVLGAQLSSWDQHDGMASALKAAISAGLSGITVSVSNRQLANRRSLALPHSR
jgi:hypothetical protein